MMPRVKACPLTTPPYEVRFTINTQQHHGAWLIITPMFLGLYFRDSDTFRSLVLTMFYYFTPNIYTLWLSIQSSRPLPHSCSLGCSNTLCHRHTNLPAISLNMQHTLKSLAMTPEFEGKLAAVNGVVITSKIPQGGQTVSRSGRELRTRFICSICGSVCRDKRDLRNHFVTCVGRNGNPNGACWDDSLNPDDAANKRTENFRNCLGILSLIWYRSNQSSTSLIDSATALSSEHRAKLDERYRKSEEGLAAVNGIIIPSKLSTGQVLSQGDYERNEHQVHPCIICDRKFAMRHQVRSHFIACVKRNGNPTGARWNDAWNGAASPAGYISMQSR